MNIDICKKCKSQQELYVDINKYMNKTVMVNIYIVSDPRYLLYKSVCEFYFYDDKNDNDYEFINIKPNKSCSYYMEHLMSKWNKEEK